MLNQVEYIIACTNLYGMIHEDRIVFIYNKHHQSSPIEQLDVDVDDLYEFDVSYKNGWYIHGEIAFEREMKDFLNTINGKPYYLPSETDLEN